jgi:hypothetical protein
MTAARIPSPTADELAEAGPLAEAGQVAVALAGWCMNMMRFKQLGNPTPINP